MGVVFFLGAVIIIVLIGFVFIITGVIIKILNKKKDKRKKRFSSIIATLFISIGILIPLVPVCFIIVIYGIGLQRAFQLQRNLDSCVEFRFVERVEKLLDKGISPNCDENNKTAQMGQSTAFMNASRGGRSADAIRIVQLMMNYGADVNWCEWSDNHIKENHLTPEFKEENPTGDRCGFTPLMNASETDSLEIVELLVENGADINAQSYCGFTPLILATKEGNAEIVKYLLEEGAIINLECYYGGTALDIANEKGSDDMVEILREWENK